MRVLTIAAFCCVLAGCARPSTQGSADRASRSVLTREQLMAANSESLYDALAKLRPDWLNTRGATSVTNPTPTQASVYMNGSMLGKLDYLREVGVLDVSEVRYWTAAQASARFGMGHPRGVIEITRTK